MERAESLWISLLVFQLELGPNMYIFLNLVSANACIIEWLFVVGGGGDMSHAKIFWVSIFAIIWVCPFHNIN